MLKKLSRKDSIVKKRTFDKGEVLKRVLKELIYILDSLKDKNIAIVANQTSELSVLLSGAATSNNKGDEKEKRFI